ncbi:TPA: YlcG family protein [Klebsiella pneumoniae]|uniref:YlcG family protein n=1 Tax=Klebsiella TaxID=570 RepID=UPI003744269F
MGLPHHQNLGRERADHYRGRKVKPEATESLRLRWQRLNLIRYRGSFPVAYRIFRNQIRNQKAGESL